jgi:hypothetical protein
VCLLVIAIQHTKSGVDGGTVTIVVIGVPHGVLVEIIDDGSRRPRNTRPYPRPPASLPGEPERTPAGWMPRRSGTRLDRYLTDDRSWLRAVPA